MKLLHKTIVLTNEAQKAKACSPYFVEEGARVLYAPCLVISEPSSFAQLDEAIEQLCQGFFSHLILTSENAVYALSCRMMYKQCPKWMLTKLKIFAVGNKTASACKKYWNITVNTDEGVHNAEQLLNTLVFSEKDRVLFPRSTKALPTVETVLAQRKVAYLAPCAYHTKNAHPDVRFLAQQKFDGICFFSPSAVEFFLASLREHQLSLCLLQSVAVACIGETTARYAALHNVTNIVSAKKPSIAAVIDALGEFYA